MSLPVDQQKRASILRLPSSLAYCFKVPLWLLVWGVMTAVPVRGADVLLTLPFENQSGRPEYHWIGESFGILFSDLLDAPGLVVISPEERNLAYERFGIRTTDLLTRAAVIRLAEAAQANLALIGAYDIGGDRKSETIAITARLIETRKGRLVGNKVFNLSGSLSELQTLQGQLAWSVLVELNPALPYARHQIVRRATSIPARAYESFVKGIQTWDPELRKNFLLRSLLEYERDAGAGHYAPAIYHLGLLHYRQQDYAEAVKRFKELTKDDPHYLESLFYLGLASYSLGDIKQSAEAFEKLIEPMPLPAVLNNAGAMMAARGESARAIPVLQRAVAASPNDLMLRFNLGYALWLSQRFAEAVPQLQRVVATNQRDGEAQYLLAKCLARVGRSAEAAQANEEAKRYLGNYAQWEAEPAKMPLLIRLKLDFNRAEFFQLERRLQSAPGVSSKQTISIQQGLERAQQLIEARREAEALAELQQVLNADPTQAEAHLLRGKIYQRRGEIESAISALTAAVYWDPRLVAAHVALGQLYLSRGDRARALAHSRQALEIDPQDRDAIALKRQIEIGR